MDTDRVLLLTIVWFSNLILTQSSLFDCFRGGESAIASLHKTCKTYPFEITKFESSLPGSRSSYQDFDNDSVKVIGCWQNEIPNYKLVLGKKGDAFQAVLYYLTSQLVSMDVVNGSEEINSLRDNLLKSVSITGDTSIHDILFIVKKTCKKVVMEFNGLGQFKMEENKSCPWIFSKNSPIDSIGYLNGWQSASQLPHLTGYDDVTINRDV